MPANSPESLQSERLCRFTPLTDLIDFSALPPEKMGAAGLTGYFPELRNQAKKGQINLQLQDWLINQVTMWGGLEQIERWLAENDRFTGRPSGVIGMDWSWLSEELRFAEDRSEK